MAVALDMSQHQKSYKYFETNPHPLQDDHGIDQHMMELTSQPDPSLHASPFWRAFPHIISFLFVYIFGGMYFNDDIFIYFPIMFFFPALVFIFVCLPRQYTFDTANIPSFVNSISWGFWFGGLSLYVCLTIVNHTVPSIMPPAAAQTYHHGTHDFWQAQIVFTALCLTSLVDEIAKCYLCHRSFTRFHGLGASTSNIHSLLANCTLNAMGMAIAKGFLALCLLGNAAAQNNAVEPEAEVVYEYRYALLNYVVKAFVVNDELYPALMMAIYSLALLPLHSMLGALWGIGFVRRFVLEHTIAFGQMLMFPWLFHFAANVAIAELFYNVVDEGFTDTATIYGASVAIPILVCSIATMAFFVLFKRTIDRSISQLHSGFLSRDQASIN